MATIMSAKAFAKKIRNVQGFDIKLPDDVQRVVLKNDSIITTRVPDDWTVNQFKKYCAKFVKVYLYEEKTHEENIRKFQKDTGKSKQAGRSKGNKSDRENLTISSDET